MQGQVRAASIGEYANAPDANSALQYTLTDHPRQEGGIGKSVYNINLNAALSSSVYKSVSKISVRSYYALIIIKS